MKKARLLFLFGLGMLLFNFDSIACGPPTIQGPDTIYMSSNPNTSVTYQIDVSQVPNPGCYTVNRTVPLPVKATGPNGHWISLFNYQPGNLTGRFSVHTITATINWRQTDCGLIWKTDVISKQVLVVR